MTTNEDAELITERLLKDPRFRQLASPSKVVDVARAIAQLAAFIGVIGAFWHISWIAGVVIAVSAIIGLAVHSAGFVRVELNRSTWD